jgi:NAD(P)-dependent dehydrogenase (short-subunit alcohol dehydrogenase family)
VNEPKAPKSPRTKVALVTGAAHRIGRAIASELGRGGWSVALHYNRSRAGAEEAAHAIVAAGGRALPLAADLSVEEDIRGLISRTRDALGPLDCLINNAAVFQRDSIETMSRRSWQDHIGVNLWAPLALIQDFASQLPQGAEGNVINLIDQRVWNLTPHFLSYTVSKSALWTLTRTLALALAPHIRVNAVGPGPALPSARQGEASFTRQTASTPLRRGTTPTEICDAIRFILAAPALTGQMIALDGGQHLGWSVPDGGAETLE